MEWKPVKDFEDYYLINRNGEVFSIRSKIIMKTRIGTDGYVFINLKVKGKNYTKKIHRLVALTLIENPFNLPQINHKDGNKTNNNVNNLEWVNAKQNCLHAINTNLRNSFKEENNIKCKLNRNTVIKIKEILKEKDNKKLSYKQIGDMFNISFRTIWDIHKKRTWRDVNE